MNKDASYIHICQNNTIFGTQFVEVPQVEGVPLVADMSSMILSKPVDVTKYGCIYFGVQKNVAPAAWQLPSSATTCWAMPPTMCPP